MFEEPPARLAAGGERLGQQVVERFARAPAAAELVGLGLQLVRRQRLHRRLELVDLGDHRPHLANLPLVRAAEQSDQPLRDPFREGRERVGRLIPNLAQQFHCRTAPRRSGRRCSKSFKNPILHQIAPARQAGRTSDVPGRRGPPVIMGHRSRCSSPGRGRRVRFGRNSGRSGGRLLVCYPSATAPGGPTPVDGAATRRWHGFSDRRRRGAGASRSHPVARGGWRGAAVCRIGRIFG